MFERVHTSTSDGLVDSQLYDQDDFYDAFVRDVRRASSEVVIESPFMSFKRISGLLPVLQMLRRHRVRIIVNTKPPAEQEPDYLQQFEQCIAQLQDAGVEVLFTGGHHRKLAIIDRQILYEGSLNILSQNDSCEVMRRIDSQVLAEQMMDFIGVERHIGL